jgi:ArsR family transcriptional regulator
MKSDSRLPTPDSHLPTSEDISTAEAIGVLKALAEPNRLRIFEFLMQGDSCNCELNEQLGLPPNLLSHHLRVLREAGLISSRRDAIDGRWIYYAVDRQGVARWRSWFDWLLDPTRIKKRVVLCGPEGMLKAGDGCRSGEPGCERLGDTMEGTVHI